jgi:hypothetical protein
MRFTRARYAITAGVAVLAGAATAAAIVVAVPASAKPAAPAAPTAPTSSPSVVLVQCNGTAVVKPTSYDPPFCMPSSQFISGLSWTSWKSNAFGAGTLKVNSCNPSCAAGKYDKFPILVVLWGAKSWPHHSGRQYFSRLTRIFTGKRPRAAKTAAQTYDLSPTGAP